MGAETRVMLELHQHEVIGKAAASDAPGLQKPLGPVQRHQQQPLEVELELLPDAQRPVRPEVAVAAVPEHHEPVVERAVEDVLTHVAPVTRRQRRLHVRGRQRAAHRRDVHLHQPRVPVRAAALVGDPVGSHVAFLEDMYGQAPVAGGGLRDARSA